MKSLTNAVGDGLASRISRTHGRLSFFNIYPSLCEGLSRQPTHGRDYHYRTQLSDIVVSDSSTDDSRSFRLPCDSNTSSLCLTSTSRVAIGDLVVILRLPSDWEDRAKFLTQRSQCNGDLQRREPILSNSRPINLKTWKSVRIEKLMD
jgi:hypothetical protein